MKTPICLVLSSLLLNLPAAGAGTSASNQGRITLDRDTTYEQNLRWQASADKTVTPAKVLRWITRLSGQDAPAPGQTEFQPIVNVNDSHIRVIAAIAYKF